jgi:undecaprenyl-diphosphatase
MSYIQALITGIIQGLTEFLPVSSSGHLVFTAELFNKFFNVVQVTKAEEIFFDLMLHFGTLIAVVVYFRVDLQNIFKSFIEAIKSKNFDTQESKLPLFLSVGTITTLITAFPLKSFLEEAVSKPELVGYFLFVTAGLLIFTEFYSQKHKHDAELSIKKAIFIGFFQGLAFAPGISRSGSTIAAGLLSGLNRVESARYSFLLSIPIIIVAVIFHTVELFATGEIMSFSLMPILLGTAVAAISGYFCIKYFLVFLQKHSLNYFAVYCIIVGICAIKFF